MFLRIWKRLALSFTYFMDQPFYMTPIIRILLLGIFLFVGCSEPAPKTLFTLLPGKKTNVTFQNLIRETEEFNVVEYGYLYNGGGVAIGDINNDSLPDIYFTGNMVRSHLYLNKGNWEFEEIADQAGVTAAGLWNTGTTMADVNGDGYLDIYVCRSAAAGSSKRRNLLFINNGDLTFTEAAGSLGLADPGYSTQAAFFDYDQDGDLDMYLLNHSIQEYAGFSSLSPQWKTKQHRDYGDKLFRNDSGKFTDQTLVAGIKTNILGFGLGVGISDVNNDGWPDIYVSNDYNEEDYLYVNNKDGTFSDRLPDYIAHVSLSSMGSDIADYNNDGYTDIFTLDMLPEDNYRQKIMFGPDNYDKYDRLISSGFYDQSMRNMLHLNIQGMGFSEIGQLAGVAATDWSWASLFADFDLDGQKDLFITNGYKHDYTNMDFMNFLVSEKLRENQGEQPLSTIETIEQMPSIRLPNYMYRNKGDLTFENTTSKWGLDQIALSNGAAYGDLDNDGDLDLVVNNVNEPAYVYRNNTRELNQNNYLKIILNGEGMNTMGIGSKVTVYHKNQQLMQELMPTRGFQSAVEQVLLYGLGSSSSVDSIEVIWPDGRIQRLPAQEANQTLAIDQKGAADSFDPIEEGSETLFLEVPGEIFTHQENPFTDFDRQLLLLHKISTMGPKMSAADLNGDGLDDIYVGGAKGHNGQVLLQDASGSFKAVWQSEREYEDTGVLFFDADGDSNQDLYVVSGGADFSADDPYLQDRLYRNLGGGNFKLASKALPVMPTSGASVACADFDQDGDLDLFIGGRHVPDEYPRLPRSYLLENDGNGNFSDITEEINPSLLYPGMITDVLWSDYDGDEVPDLILTGEWMPVRIFKNTSGSLNEVTNESGISSITGWWNCIEPSDLDQDGDIDYVVGNFGWNSQIKASNDEPVTLHAKDFDNNGQVDPILCYYVMGESYPAFSKDDMEKQLPLIKRKYLSYTDYADEKITDMFSTEELADATLLQATELSTGYFQNQGDGTFKFINLPVEAQVSPVFAVLVEDFDGDGVLDILLGGNFRGTRVKFGAYNASYGTMLKGDNKGGFFSLPVNKTGLMVRGEVRDIIHVTGVNGEKLVLWARNNDSIELLKVNSGVNRNY